MTSTRTGRKASYPPKPNERASLYRFLLRAWKSWLTWGRQTAMLNESLHFTCFLIGPLLVGGAGLPDFHSPGGGSIHLDAPVKDRVKVTTDYWRLEFDLRSGGALDTIVFPHGSGKNLLKKPFRAHVNELSDWNAVETALESSQEGDVVRLVFSGTMAAIGRVPGPVGFESVWTLSPFVVRADCTLKFAEHMTASSVGVASTALRSDLNEFSVLSGSHRGRRSVWASF